MRFRLVPLAILTALGVVALGPSAARAQYNSSMRPNFYTPSNYGTPNASAFRPSGFGMSRPSIGMPNPYQYMPSFGSLNSGTPTPIGVVHTLPGTAINGVNFGAPPAANMPMPADGTPITVNVPQPSAALLNALPAAEQAPPGTPTPENAPAATAQPLPTDATTQSTFGSLVQGTYVPNALVTPGAVPATTVPAVPAAPATAPAGGVAAPLRVISVTPAVVPAPSYGTFTPAPRYPASISSALNRVYGSGY